jgi:N-acetylglucosaminylphosphatidylinositol deacetylase
MSASDFPDSMTTIWSKEKISTLLTSLFAPDTNKSSKSKTKAKDSPPTASIDVIITFDSTGISSHPNHISLYHGARHFISSLLAGHAGWRSPIELYTLTSISIFRKYSSFVDSALSIIFMAFGKKTTGSSPSPLLFMSTPGEVRVAQKAMTHAHISQMRWFRWGWIGLSRYMVLNDLKLEKVL